MEEDSNNLNNGNGNNILDDSTIVYPIINFESTPVEELLMETTPKRPRGQNKLKEDKKTAKAISQFMDRSKAEQNSNHMFAMSLVAHLDGLPKGRSQNWHNGVATDV